MAGAKPDLAAFSRNSPNHEDYLGHLRTCGDHRRWEIYADAVMTSSLISPAAPDPPPSPSDMQRPVRLRRRAKAKKSGKTGFAALFTLTIILLFGEAFAEGYALANDQEQAVGRVFQSVKRIVEASPLLNRVAKITADKIVFPTFRDATIMALASTYSTVAGANPVVSTFDELWAYTSENSRRLWDEMISPPTRKIACRLVVTYAGFTGESQLLEELYRRGHRVPHWPWRP
jgi:hypothetical protein